MEQAGSNLEHTPTSDDPLPGPPWDLPVADVPWVFFDTEMTGLDPAHDQLVEVSFLREERGQIVAEHSALVAASVPSVPAAAALHGIGADDIAQAAPFAVSASPIAELLRGAIPVGHGVAMDVIFLSRAYESCGIAAPNLRHVVDTLTLARRAVASPRYTLAHLVSSLGLPPRRYHRAREDALAVRDLFRALVRALDPASPRDLWEVRVGQRDSVRVRGSIARAIESLLRSRAPCRVVVRMRGRDPTSLDGVVEHWESPHVRLRSLSPRGGVRVLRADRILRIEPVR